MAEQRFELIESESSVTEQKLPLPLIAVQRGIGPTVEQPPAGSSLITEHLTPKSGMTELSGVPSARLADGTRGGMATARLPVE